MFLLMATLTGITFLSCNDDDKEERETIVMEEVTNNIICAPDNSEVNVVKVINNYEELQEFCAFTTGLDSYEIVDFSKYSIILAYGIIAGGTSNDLIKGKLECYKGEYSLIIDIWNDDTEVNMSYWHKWFLVKKIDSLSKVSLKVNLHKN